MEKLTLSMKGANSLTKPANTSVKLALADRLTLSEAIEIVTIMIRGYANRGSADKSYIGAIAHILLSYPRNVAIKCGHPIHGVVRDTKFMPTPSDVIGWCEKSVQPMHEESDREDRIKKQLEERRKWESKARPIDTSRHITYDEFLKLSLEGKTNQRPIGASEPGGYLGPQGGV